MFVDIIVVQWVLFAAASAAAFMIGRTSSPDKNEIIEDTIVFLVENNFCKAKKVDGELELQKLDE